MTPAVTPAVTPATRRTVLAAGAVAGAIVVVPGAAELTRAMVGPRAAPELVRDSFFGHVGESFTAAVDGREVRLVLDEVADLPDGTGATAGDPRSFAVTFTGDVALGQATYQLRRPGFPAAPVFLVPGRTTGRGGLTGVFNRQGVTP